MPRIRVFGFKVAEQLGSGHYRLIGGGLIYLLLVVGLVVLVINLLSGRRTAV